MAIDKEYLRNMTTWFKTMHASVEKTKSIIKACDEDTKRNNAIAKVERVHLKNVLKRIDNARKEHNDYIKNNR